MSATDLAAGPLPEVLTLPLAHGPDGTAPAIMDRLRRERPVARVLLPSGDRAWLITRRTDITMIGSDRRFSRDFTTPGSPSLTGATDFNAVPGGIFNLDPPDHTRVRRLVQRFFSPAAAAAVAPALAGHAERLIDGMLAGPRPTDLMSGYALPLSLHMACEVMGVRIEQRRKIVPELRVQLDWAAESTLVGASTERLLAFADEVIDAKRDGSEAESDPVEALIQARARGEVSEQELRATVMYLFLTSAEPVAGPTCVGVYTLLRHPEQLRRVLDEDTDEMWERAVWELLRRHHNSVSALPRVATEDVEVAGVLIHAGDVVFMPWVAASCDPAHYAAPNEFRLDRDPAEEPAVTFGTGPHFCLGANIARTHLKVALRTLWTRLPELRLAVPFDQVVWEPPEYLFVRPVRLPITW